jgi:hypothetical protein
MQPMKRFRKRCNSKWLLDAALRHDSCRARTRRCTKVICRYLCSAFAITNLQAKKYFFGHHEILALELARAEPKADGPPRSINYVRPSRRVRGASSSEL